MRQVPLGRTGVLLPEITLGSMTWGTQTGQADAHAQIDMARAHGIDWIDTAEMYPVNPVRAETSGDTETIIGNWLAKAGQGAMKIATKVSGVGNKAVRDGAPITPDALRAAVEGSLRRLQVDHIDLYQLHWPNRGSYHFRQNWTFRPKGARAGVLADMEGCLAMIATLVAEGKIGAFGLSNESAWGCAQWLALAEAGVGPRVAAVQNEYSLMARLYDTDMAEVGCYEDITLLAFSPLAAGLLTGKYLDGSVPQGSRRAVNTDLGGRWQPGVDAAVRAYLAVAAKHGLDPVHMALAWCQTRPFATTALLGATTCAQLEHGLGAIGLMLDPEVVTDLDAVHRAHPMPY
jgi:aryl-alcohol dehydrogenase-like predicted oxidoreductase